MKPKYTVVSTIRQQRFLYGAELLNNAGVVTTQTTSEFAECGPADDCYVQACAALRAAVALETVLASGSVVLKDAEGKTQSEYRLEPS